MKKFVSLVLLTLFTATLGFAQSSARVVKYQPDDIIAIKAKLRYTTLIQLPVTEKILEVATGDKDFWIIDALQNLCFLHPAKAGIKSNLNLITDKGNVYSFTLEEVTGDPDLKVVVEPSNSSALATVNQTPQLVPAAEVEALGAQAQMLRLQADQAVTQFKSEYPTKLVKFDYLFKDEKPFNIAAIYHDDRFTYIRSEATEKFTVYDVKDSKPNLVNFELKDGTYVLPKVVDSGYLEIGKKHLTFERKQQ
jgi:type IV secretion system protein VirB9